MASISTAIYTILRLNANVLSTFADRITPVIVPQDVALPAITYRLTGIDRTETQASSSNIDRHMVRISIYATKYLDLETYQGYVVTAMDRYTGTQASLVILNIQYTNVSDDIEEVITPDSTTPGQFIFIRHLDFTIISK